MSENVEAEYQDDGPDDDSVPLEPRNRVVSNFLEDDNEFEGPTVNLLKPHPLQSRNANLGQAFGQNMGMGEPVLPANLQKVKNIFDFFENMKAMKKLEKQKKSLKKNDKELEQMMYGQEQLMDLVTRQNEKNKRLENYLLKGLQVDKLKKGQDTRDPNYDPLDDISFEEIDLDGILGVSQQSTAADTSRKKKKKKAKNAEGE